MAPLASTIISSLLQAAPLVVLKDTDTGIIRAKNLTLFLAKSTECSQQYIFAFQVVNGGSGQNSPGIQIEASYVGQSKLMFQSGSAIPASLMDLDNVTVLSQTGSAPFVQVMAAGDAAALKIWNLMFVASIRQSTPVPCAVNTLELSFVTNIPLLRNGFCTPRIVLRGLTSAIAPPGIINVSSTGPIFFPVSQATWDNNIKALSLFCWRFVYRSEYAV
jgi:hypothetical protein